jgi:uncharacterized oxidoreductase
MTVTIKAKALEAFVADIFAVADARRRRAGRIGRYLGERESCRATTATAWCGCRATRRQKKNGTVVPTSRSRVVGLGEDAG